jgi:hypothetical protein
MTNNEYSALVARHRDYFRTGATRGVEWRKSQLTALRTMMTERAEDFCASLWTDLRRGRVEQKSSGQSFPSWRSAVFRRSLTSSTRGQVPSDFTYLRRTIA